MHHQLLVDFQVCEFIDIGYLSLHQPVAKIMWQSQIHCPTVMLNDAALLCKSKQLRNQPFECTQELKEDLVKQGWSGFYLGGNYVSGTLASRNMP